MSQKSDFAPRPIANPEDLALIMARDPEVDFKRLYRGSDGLLRRSFNWENKYKLQFSNPIKPEEIKAAISVGMVPKSKLQDGAYYWGVHENTRVVRWSQGRQKFEYNYANIDRIEFLHHPEDLASGLDSLEFFAPFYLVEPKDFEIIET